MQHHAQSRGAIYDDMWNVVGTYDDQVDNYGQEHTQLHYRYSNLFGGTFAAALHHTAGAGYYEEYNQGSVLGLSFMDFGLMPYYTATGDTVAYGDVVTRKWLDNDFLWRHFFMDLRSRRPPCSAWAVACTVTTGAHFGRVDLGQQPECECACSATITKAMRAKTTRIFMQNTPSRRTDC